MLSVRTIGILTIGLLGLTLPIPTSATTYSFGLLAGTHGGPGGSLQMTAAGFAPQVSWKARVGATYSIRNPGKADEVREIFINDATDGTPEKKGRLWTFGLDLILPLWKGRRGSIDFFGGPRYGSFNGNFRYVGGNEDFDVRERTWAFGGGIEHHLPLSDRVHIAFQAGADAYLRGALSGHDTTYSPDGEDVNSREDFTYEDADDAVHQPKIAARVMAGVLVRLGS